MISGLKKLKCLSVSINCLYLDYADSWLGRNSLWEISKLKSLQVLNISNNKHCLNLFEVGCLKLETFICSNNNVSYKAIAARSFAKRV
jgi:hypothetical protein